MTPLVVGGGAVIKPPRLTESIFQSVAKGDVAGHGQSLNAVQKQQKLQLEWKQICKVLDHLPGGVQMKSRYSFSRADLVALVGQFRQKIQDLEQLVQYEQQKNIKHNRDYSGLLEELKEVKIEKRHYQEQLNKIPDLKMRIEAQEAKLEQCIDQLKKSMIANVVCLEFNKDIQTLMNKFQFEIESVA